jgi:hypothetical protein
LRKRLGELEPLLHERTTELNRTKAALDAFEVSYRHKVGTLHERLEQLELAIADAELGEISKRLDDAGWTQPPAAARPEPSPRLTSDAVRKLFRDVAKAIHPDLAGDVTTRDRRHSLMIEANKAYALRDEPLRDILDAWERSPEAVLGDDPEAMRLRLARRIGQIEDQLEVIACDLAALNASPLGKLKTLVDEAAARGEDLVCAT